MFHVYDKQCLDDAMRNFGEAVDYAVDGCGVEPDDVYNWRFVIAI